MAAAKTAAVVNNEASAIDTQLVRDFRSARRSSVPIVGVQTPDMAMTVQLLQRAVDPAVPVVQWDIVRGLVEVNKPGGAELRRIGADPMTTGNPVEALTTISKLKEDALVFMLNAHLYLTEATVKQAIWNLRDQFKVDGRMLVLLGATIKLPAELQGDVVVLDEPLPTPDELRAIIEQTYKNAGDKVPAPTPDVMVKAIDAVMGLPAFAVEQITAMCMRRTGLDLPALWERKRQEIEQTPGLSVWRGGESFADVGGCDNIKGFLTRVLAGNQPPRAVVFIDEIEKMLGGAGSGQGDSSGVSQDQLGQLLSYMQDTNATGMIFVGPPGAAKSLIAKATGNTANVPTIQFDLGGMKGSLVGQSEQNTRTALKVVTAVAQGRALFIATCNSIGALPPELRRRFTFGTFFFDLPTAAERDAIWQLFIRKFDLDAKAIGPRPVDENWTGAEIQQCCKLAFLLKCTLQDAAGYIVPVATSAGEVIERLRQQATGRFISAAAPGVYQHPSEAPAASPSPAGRRVRVAES